VGPRAGRDRSRKISPHTEIQFPDRPARSESLHRLSYPGPGFSQSANLKLHLSLLHPICTSITRDISLKNTFFKTFPPRSMSDSGCKRCLRLSARIELQNFTVCSRSNRQDVLQRRKYGVWYFTVHVLGFEIYNDNTS